MARGAGEPVGWRRVAAVAAAIVVVVLGLQLLGALVPDVGAVLGAWPTMIVALVAVTALVLVTALRRGRG